MKQGMRDHWAACGRTFAFLTIHALLSGGETESLEVSYWLCFMSGLVSSADQGEAEHLFLQGWEAGTIQAQQAWETGNMALYEDIGRAAGYTTRRSPRHYRGYTPARDGLDGNIQGEALKRFVRGWRQTAAEALRNRGV